MRELQTFEQYLDTKRGSEREFLPYAELLELKEWKDKRQVILSRDKSTCQRCNRITPWICSRENCCENPLWGVCYPHSIRLGLEIHHKYYILGKLPWEYDDTALLSLCGDCHELSHGSIKYYLNETDTVGVTGLTRCWKCGGKGYLSEYKYYCCGRCFACGGTGYEEFGKLKYLRDRMAARELPPDIVHPFSP